MRVSLRQILRIQRIRPPYYYEEEKAAIETEKIAYTVFFHSWEILVEIYF